MKRPEISTRSQTPCDPAMRQKRRQSDAKWRANIATCYHTLKQIIERGNITKKKKTSKAMILEETGKHVLHLEGLLTNLLKMKASKTDGDTKHLTIDNVKKSFLCQLQDKRNMSKLRSRQVKSGQSSSSSQSSSTSTTYVYTPVMTTTVQPLYTDLDGWSYYNLTDSGDLYEVVDESSQVVPLPLDSQSPMYVDAQEGAISSHDFKSCSSTRENVAVVDLHRLPLVDHADYTVQPVHSGSLSTEADSWDKEFSTPKKSGGGFTPVKLSSPWKLFEYIDSEEDEDNLLCKESFEQMDISDDEHLSRKVRCVPRRKVSCSGKAEMRESHKRKPKCRRQLERSYSEEPSERDASCSKPSDRDASCSDLPPLADVDQSDDKHFDGYCYFYREVANQLGHYLTRDELDSPDVSGLIKEMWEDLPEEQVNTMVTMAILECSQSSDDLSDDLKDVCVSPIDTSLLSDEDTCPYALDALEGILRIKQEPGDDTDSIATHSLSLATEKVEDSLDDTENLESQDSLDGTQLEDTLDIRQYFARFMQGVNSSEFPWLMEEDKGVLFTDKSPMLSQASINKVVVPSITLSAVNEDTNDHVVPQMKLMDIAESDDSEQSLLQLSPWRSIGLIDSVDGE